jgi:hypothetical protein
LSHFGEAAPDCGTSRAQYGETLQSRELSQLTKILESTTTLEPFRYRPGVQAESLNQQIQEDKAKVQSRTKFTFEYYKNLMPLLVQKGIIAESQQSAKVSDYQRSWIVFSLTPQGSICRAVPESVRELERQQAAVKREKTLQELASKRGDEAFLGRQLHWPGLCCRSCRSVGLKTFLVAAGAGAKRLGR